MRQLLPDASDDVDLDLAYAYPREVADRAWVRANMVASVDGSAQLDGRAGSLGTPADRRVFGVLRGLADVVLVGSATVKAEGYRPAKPKESYAAQRTASGQPVAPAMAVVSRRLQFSPDDPIFCDAAVRSIVVTTTDSDPAQRAALAEVADVIVAGEVAVDLRLTATELARRGLPRVLCEGGPAVLASVAHAGALDELCLTVTPMLVAGSGSRILRGDWLDPVQRLQLAHLLEEDGTLLARYLVDR
jgi:riboflavin biosynthesis pyrimidine reductase